MENLGNLCLAPRKSLGWASFLWDGAQDTLPKIKSLAGVRIMSSQVTKKMVRNVKNMYQPPKFNMKIIWHFILLILIIFHDHIHDHIQYFPHLPAIDLGFHQLAQSPPSQSPFLCEKLDETPQIFVRSHAFHLPIRQRHLGKSRNAAVGFFGSIPTIGWAILTNKNGSKWGFYMFLHETGKLGLDTLEATLRCILRRFCNKCILRFHWFVVCYSEAQHKYSSVVKVKVKQPRMTCGWK
jgi:hypothetical protein